MDAFSTAQADYSNPCPPLSIRRLRGQKLGRNQRCVLCNSGRSFDSLPTHLLGVCEGRDQERDTTGCFLHGSARLFESLPTHFLRLMRGQRLGRSQGWFLCNSARLFTPLPALLRRLMRGRRLGRRQGWMLLSQLRKHKSIPCPPLSSGVCEGKN